MIITALHLSEKKKEWKGKFSYTVELRYNERGYSVYLVYTVQNLTDPLIRYNEVLL